MDDKPKLVKLDRKAQRAKIADQQRDKLADMQRIAKSMAALPDPAPPLTSPCVTRPAFWPRYTELGGWSLSCEPRHNAPHIPAILPDRDHNGDAAQIAYALCAAYVRVDPDGSIVPPAAHDGGLWACGDDTIWRCVEVDEQTALLASWSGRAVARETRNRDGALVEVYYDKPSTQSVQFARKLPKHWGQEEGWLASRPAVLAFGGEAVRVADGLQGLVRERLTPSHGARWGFAWQLPLLPSTDAALSGPDAPLWSEYLSGMFDGEADGHADTDERTAYLETWLGLALLGLAPRLQLPALILCGAPGTGKSTLARLIAENLYPDGAVSQVEPQQWGSTDAAGYHLATLAGKLLNAVYDLDLTAPITDPATLKKVVFGEPLAARQIRSEPVSFVPRAAHLWCGNGLPKVTGADPALWARMLPLVVSGRSWRGTPGERRDLGEALKGELPQIVARLLWRAQAALERMARGERLLEPPPSSVARLAAWRDTADSVALWRSERLTHDPALPAIRSITRPAAWQNYQAWCADTRHLPCAQQEWARRLEAQGVVIKRAGHGGVVLERYSLSEE